MSIVMGYVTFKNKAEANKICTFLVKKKLIACANVLSSHEAIYEWNDKFYKQKEVAVLIKTKKTNTKKVISEIRKMHSYENPCIVFWPLKQGSKDFLSWVAKQSESI
jgi:periplasmic divalent cation tolerance protein